MPPIYARWQAAVATVDRTATGWLNDLNLDPRNRSGAGLGTQIVQSETTQLMASAWQQVAGVLQANQLLRQAQLARAASQQIYRQHFQPAQAETVLNLTTALHARLLAGAAPTSAAATGASATGTTASGTTATRTAATGATTTGPSATGATAIGATKIGITKIGVTTTSAAANGAAATSSATNSAATIKAALRASCVPERLLSGVFRRLARLPAQRGMAQSGAPSLLSRVSSGALAIVPAIAPPGGLVSIDQITSQVAAAQPPPAGGSPPAPAGVAVRFANLTSLAVVNVAAQPTFQIIAAGAPLPTAPAAPLAAASAAPLAAASAAGPEAGAVRAAAAPAAATLETGSAQAAPPPAAAAAADSAHAAAFRTATSQLFGTLQALPANAAPLPALDVPTLASTILTRIDPVATVPRRVQSLIAIGAPLQWQPRDPLDPIMAAPTFAQPMYAPLRDLSPSYLLPGVEAVPPNSLGLLQSNRRFIEAYMAGLNDEMARQLLWNAYPTDPRGSYFRQFWDVMAYVPQPTDPTDPAQLAELLKDIPPIDTWPLAVPLGQHPNRTDVVPDNLVLLVRGELFKRYPNAIVYAGKATPGAAGELALDDSAELYPLFRGTLAPDMTFLGFNLTAADARGGTANSPNGYFFVFQEQPSEPRFGLEPTAGANPVTAWSDLAWTNFAAAGASPVVAVPAANRSQPAVLAGSPWRLASQVFSLVLQNSALPAFLSPVAAPQGVAIAAGTEDTQCAWGVNSAQTASILLRLPFRVLIHAKLMLPAS